MVILSQKLGTVSSSFSFIRRLVHLEKNCPCHINCFYDKIRSSSSSSFDDVV